MSMQDTQDTTVRDYDFADAEKPDMDEALEVLTAFLKSEPKTHIVSWGRPARGRTPTVIDIEWIADGHGYSLVLKADGSWEVLQ